jgi:hypothetical protein
MQGSGMPPAAAPQFGVQVGRATPFAGQGIAPPPRQSAFSPEVLQMMMQMLSQRAAQQPGRSQNPDSLRALVEGRSMASPGNTMTRGTPNLLGPGGPNPLLASQASQAASGSDISQAQDGFWAKGNPSAAMSNPTGGMITPEYLGMLSNLLNQGIGGGVFPAGAYGVNM